MKLSNGLRRAVEEIAQERVEHVEPLIKKKKSARAAGSIAWAEVRNAAPVATDELAHYRELAQRAASLGALVDRPGSAVAPGEYSAAIARLNREERRLLARGVLPAAIDEALESVNDPSAIGGGGRNLEEENEMGNHVNDELAKAAGAETRPKSEQDRDRGSLADKRRKRAKEIVESRRPKLKGGKDE
ncbi:MAG: hypothetical protein EA385_00095 [Salinarimonadaceae bacterium]|nr:MAG: hypothetical protein EA385_00095 [Salinarimonadaceae bacterium]